MTEPLPLPKDPKHQRFADLVLGGMSGPDAYRAVKLKPIKNTSVHVMASRLLKKVEVSRYMAAVRQQAAKGAVLSVMEKREFLARIVRTPVMSIQPNDPNHKDGDLILKYKRVVTESGEHEEIVKLDPLKAIAQDNELAGDGSAAETMDEIADALSSIAGSFIPREAM